MAKEASRALEIGADLVEFRLDALQDADESGIHRELSDFFERAVVTIRAPTEGGWFKGSERERLRLISSLAAMDPAFLDVELATVKNHRSWFSSVQRGRTKVVVSWHDFTGTPRPSKLARLAQEALGFGGMPKIVPTARTLEDNLSVLSLYEESRSRKSGGQDGLIAFCMGERGVTSRILSLALGSPIVYSSVGESHEVAPGQLPLRVMLRIRSLLGGAEGREQ